MSIDFVLLLVDLHDKNLKLALIVSQDADLYFYFDFDLDYVAVVRATVLF